MVVIKNFISVNFQKSNWYNVHNFRMHSFFNGVCCVGLIHIAGSVGLSLLAPH